MRDEFGSIETQRRINIQPTIKYYLVRAHDPYGGLWQIAEHCGVSFEAIKKANPELVRQGWKLWGGEVLVIPPPSVASPSQGRPSTGTTPEIRLHRHRRFSPPSFNSGNLAGGGRVLALGGLRLEQLGSLADFQRNVYRKGAERILQMALDMLAHGKNEREVARWCVKERNALKVFVRQLGPRFFESLVELRNKRKYGGAIDPSYEQLAKGVRRPTRTFRPSGPRPRTRGQDRYHYHQRRDRNES